jgi:hypothetical protein
MVLARSVRCGRSRPNDPGSFLGSTDGFVIYLGVRSVVENLPELGSGSGGGKFSSHGMAPID